MSVGPRNFGHEVTVRGGDSPDLEPSEYRVKFWRARDEAKRASNIFDAAKTSKEKKQVAWANLVAREMALCGARLSEDRTPSGAARNRLAAQIRIEMRAVASTNAASRQVFDNLRD